MGTCYQGKTKPPFPKRLPHPEPPQIPHYCQDDEFDQIFIHQCFDPTQDKRKRAEEKEMNLPFCKIGLLVFERVGSKETSFATGFLIKENLVLTSAHTFSYRDTPERRVYQYKPKAFYYQLNGKYTESVKYDVDDYRLNELFHEVMLKRQGNNFQMTQRLIKDMIPHDYALIKLKNPVKEFSPPKILKNYRMDAKDSTAIVYGYSEYHMEKDYSLDGNIIGGYIVGQQRQITNTQDNYVNHNIQTSKCQSGSPIFFRRNNPLGEVESYLIGIHCGYFVNNYHQKYGVLISNSFIDRLADWENQMMNKIGSELMIYEFHANRRKIQKASKFKDLKAEEQKQEQKQKQKQAYKHQEQANHQISLKSIGPKNYREFNLRFDMQMEGAQYYQVKETVVDKRQQQTIQRRKFGPEWKGKSVYLVSKTYLQEGKWFINFYVAKYSNEPIVIGFMNKQKQRLELKECNYLCLRKDKKLEEEQEVGVIWSNDERVKGGRDVSLKQKILLRIFINMEEKKIYWGFNAYTVVECQFKQEKIGLFISFNNDEKIVIVKKKKDQ